MTGLNNTQKVWKKYGKKLEKELREIWKNDDIIFSYHYFFQLKTKINVRLLKKEASPWLADRFDIGCEAAAAAPSALYKLISYSRWAFMPCFSL